MKKRITILFNNRKPAYLTYAMAFFLCMLPISLSALNLTARPDNFFVTPGEFEFLNILRNDDPGDCTLMALKVTIVSPPSHALLCTVNSANQIRYRAVNGYTGTDQLTYQIECNGTVSTANVYLHVNDMPDNITPDVCHIPPPPQIWGITPKHSTLETHANYQIPITGDIDGDGIVEIIVGGDLIMTGTQVTKIYIYKGNNISTPWKSFTTVAPFIWGSPTKYTIAKTKISGVETTLIVVAENDRYLRAYDYNGGLIWTSDTEYHATSASEMPGFADMNGDGVPEIIISGKIYNSTNGKLLCQAATTGHTTATDLFNTGELNLLVGNSIYKPNTALTSVSLVRKITPVVNPSDPDKPSPLPTIPDGGSPIAADIDNDGKLDLIIRVGVLTAPDYYTFIYVADPATGAIKGSKFVPNAGSSSLFPFVGDIDGDGRPEIVFIKNQYVNYGRGDGTSEVTVGADPQYCKMLAYKYVPGNQVLQQFWSYQHYDYSGQTGMTIFDFNQDGIAEIVYRDEWNMRIINGSLKSHTTGLPVPTPYNLATFPNFSGTGCEYPIVADVDGDGQAEMLIVGAVNNSNSESAGYYEYSGALWVFKSSNPSTSPWAPARKVWNQYAFNPVYINSDLTVPPHPISPATAFYEADGVTVNRPYNNFLQQGTDLNDEGDMLYLGPDLEFSPAYRSKMLYDQANNRLEVTIYVHNRVEVNAGAAFIGPLQIDTYVYERSTGTYTIMSSTSESINIGVDETKTITYYINGYSSLAFPPTYDNWVIVLNSNTAGSGEPTFYKGSVECNWWNNFNANISFSNAERTICEGVTETVTIEPGPGVYKYEWYEWDQVAGSGKGLLVNTGDSYDVKKNANPTQHYLIDVYTNDGLIKLSSVPDTVFVWLTPDSLIWTGGANTYDWHNYNNWKNPDDPTGLYQRANIPRKCTDVLIPDMLVRYPDLDASQTSYTYYSKSECANIWFEHGGEVKQNDVLDYDSAYVYLALESDRWNMITVPLQYQYPGDYYLTDPNPHKDSLFVYTRLFSQANPETKKYVEADWTGEFNNPEFKMPAGQGLSAWLWDKRTDAIVTDTFLFPKHDLTYRMYDLDGNIVQTPRSTPRTQGLGANDHEHRFIYEPIINSGGEFPLQVTAANANKLVLVGNPFMSHLDFKSFYAVNGPSGNNCIKNYYQVLDETGNYISYNATTGVSTGTPPLNQYIAPLQSFLVESRTTFSQLYADVYMMQNRAGEKLRSSQSTQTEQSILSLELTDVSTGQQNRTLLILNPESDNSYDETDIPKTLPILNRKGTILPIPASIFTRSTDGIALDVNQIPSLEENLSIPVVIRSDKKGIYRLKLNLMSGFPTDQNMYLVDLADNKEYELQSDVWVEFNKPTASELLESRFYLTFKKSVTGIESPVNTIPGIEAYISGNTLRVFTTDNSNLEEVELYDLQGRQVSTNKNINKTEFKTTVQSNQFYIVRAKSSSTNRSVKVYGKTF